MLTGIIIGMVIGAVVAWFVMSGEIVLERRHSIRLERHNLALRSRIKELHEEVDALSHSVFNDPSEDWKKN